jgi:hypothetical protein
MKVKFLVNLREINWRLWVGVLDNCVE